MAGYIGKSQGVTQVDGYNRSEADAEFLNDPNEVIVVSGNNVGIGTSSFPANGKNLKIEDATISRLVLANTGDSTFEIGSIAGGSLNIYDATADAERLRIDSAGRVTMPFQPYIRLRGNVPTEATSQGTNTIFTFWDTLTSRGITFNSSTGAITVPVSGRYLISAKFYFWIDNVSSHIVVLNVNGSAVQEYPTDFSGLGTGGRTDHVVTVSEIFELSANDYITFLANADIYGGSVHTNCQVALIG